MNRVVVGLVVLLAVPALAQTRWGLTWRAPEACIGPGDLAQAVEERLGQPVFAKDPQYRIEGSLQAGASPKWKARFTLVSAAGEVLGTRELTADDADCRALDKRIALAVALTIEPELRKPAQSTPPPSSGRAPLATAEPTREEPPPLPRNSVFVHMDSESRDVRLLRFGGTSYGTGYGSRGPVTVAISTFADECRAPCDQPIQRADDRFYVGGSGVVMTSEFILSDHAKRGRVNMKVKAGDAGAYSGGMIALIGGLTAGIAGASLALAGAISGGSSSSGFLIGGGVTLLAGLVLTAIGIPVMNANRSEVTFDDGTVVH